MAPAALAGTMVGGSRNRITRAEAVAAAVEALALGSRTKLTSNNKGSTFSNSRFEHICVKCSKFVDPFLCEAIRVRLSVLSWLVSLEGGGGEGNIFWEV